MADERLVMFGTGDFAVPTFRRLLEAGRNVVALVTQPDRPQGRHREIVVSPIKALALGAGVRVLQPEDVNAPESLAILRELAPDLIVTAAYGQILSADLLAIPRLGGINLHGSILPAYRGAAPVARAIQRGETETGVTVIAMNPKVDAGAMLAVARTPIGPDETAGELETRLAELGAPLVLEVIASLLAGTATAIPQDPGRATKAPKLKKERSTIDWAWPAERVHNFVRAMNPWPLARTSWQPTDPGRPPLTIIVHRTRPVDGQGEPGTVLDAPPGVLRVAAGQGAVELVTVQIPGKKPMPAAEFLRGHRLRAGDRLG